MKNVLIVIALFALVNLNSCCQNSEEIPDGVKTAFSQEFPDATQLEWVMENNNELEAEFMLNGTEYSATYDASGNWMETEYEITESEIPAAVKATLDNEFTGYKIEESELSETAKGKVYEFALRQGKEEM